MLVVKTRILKACDISYFVCYLYKETWWWWHYIPLNLGEDFDTIIPASTGE